MTTSIFSNLFAIPFASLPTDNAVCPAELTGPLPLIIPSAKSGRLLHLKKDMDNVLREDFSPSLPMVTARFFCDEALRKKTFPGIFRCVYIGLSGNGI